MKAGVTKAENAKFMQILFIEDVAVKKEAIRALPREEQLKFVPWYKSTAQMFRENPSLMESARAAVLRIQARNEQKAAILNQFGAQAASELSSITVGSTNNGPKIKTRHGY